LKLGRHFVGTEIAQEYFEIMQNNLNDWVSLNNIINPVASKDE
jgi:DNA modification methylase